MHHAWFHLQPFIQVEKKFDRQTYAVKSGTAVSFYDA